MTRLSLFLSLFLFLPICSTSGCSPAPTLSGDMAVINVDIVDLEAGAVERNRMILIEGDSIMAVAPNAPRRLEDSIRVVDGAGRTALPGLWDSHTHMLADPSGDLDTIATAYLDAGVTHIRDMGATYAQLDKYRNWRKTGSATALKIKTSGPRLAGRLLPYGSPDQFEIVTTEEEARTALVRQVEAGADFGKMYGPFDAKQIKMLSGAARAENIPLSGHIQFDVSLDEMVEAAPVSLEHFGYVFNGCGDVDSSVAFNASIAARFRGEGNPHDVFLNYLDQVDWSVCVPTLKRMAEARIAWTPTLGILAGYGDNRALELDGLPDDDLCRTEDAAFAEDPRYRPDLQKSLSRAIKALQEAGVDILAGSDARTFCMDHGRGLITELKLLVRFGLSPLEALRAATLTPSDYYGDRSYGRIAPGFPVDFILLDASPLHDIDALDTVSAVITQAGCRERTTPG